MFSVAYTNIINTFLSYNNYTEALYYIVIHLGYGGVRVFRRKAVALEVYLRHHHPSSVPPVVCVLCVCVLACVCVCMCVCVRWRNMQTKFKPMSFAVFTRGK